MIVSLLIDKIIMYDVTSDVTQNLELCIMRPQCLEPMLRCELGFAILRALLKVSTLIVWVQLQNFACRLVGVFPAASPLSRGLDIQNLVRNDVRRRIAIVPLSIVIL